MDIPASGAWIWCLQIRREREGPWVQLSRSAVTRDVAPRLLPSCFPATARLLFPFDENRPISFPWCCEQETVICREQGRWQARLGPFWHLRVPPAQQRQT